jgi:hypothetical protein
MYDKKTSTAVSAYLKNKFSETGPKSSSAGPPKRDEGGVIIRGRRKAAREMRNTSRTTSDGKKETVRMEWGEGPGKYKYQVNPTIFPEKDGTWKDLGGQGMAAYSEAKKRGEVIGFKSKRRAEKFAAGSWKKGPARKEAMRNYRQMKKEERQNKNNG